MLAETLELWARAYPQFAAALRRTAREIEQKYDAQDSFKARREKILGAIRAGNWRADEIVRVTGIPRATLYRTLKRLCADGQIVEVRSSVGYPRRVLMLYREP